ncbi:MAG: DNA-binding FrmR family transcriptional regulator [Pirellulaceae bacterium]|jgi:DNA-binding FrmR family transcriptional regulator
MREAVKEAVKEAMREAVREAVKEAVKDGRGKHSIFELLVAAAFISYHYPQCH